MYQSVKKDHINFMGTNPLIGKKLSVNGDSICAGAGYSGGYAKIIGFQNNMEQLHQNAFQQCFHLIF